ncbi:response regulator [Pseudomonas otitidis]|uniref:response regulator n=1 Tax=Metapseudomonas otitidis TaxID=319939 RepID=UPI002E7B061C|nr:response regulator [Pseudomonas otitidis]MEE1895665.1 response regulator [Pseudomonas otitidis]
MDDRPRIPDRKPWLPVAAALVLLVALGALVVWQWQAERARYEAENQQRFDMEVDEVAQRISDRMRAYEVVLRGMSGLLAGSDEVSADEWARAVDQLQLQDRYPGIQALGWSRYLAPADLVAQPDDEGARVEVRLFPPGEREHYLVITYISPLDWRNKRALGFDMLSEPMRRQAVQAAIDSGEARLTGPIVLRQDEDNSPLKGLVLFMPVYGRDAPATATERREAFIGTVYGAFRVQDLMAGILGAQARLFDIELADLQYPDQPLLDPPDAAEPAPYQDRRELRLFGRDWQLQVTGTAAYASLQSDGGLRFTLVAGLSAALLLSLLVGAYLYLRERELLASSKSAALLQEREAHLRALVARLPVATLLCEGDGRIELANDSAGELLGCDSEWLVGQHALRFLPGASELEALAFESEHASISEYEARCDDGRRTPVALRLTRIDRADGRRYLINLLDLQARRSAEERFRLVVEASPNAILLVDTGGRIAMVNRQVEQMFGYSRQELLGERVERLLPVALREAHVGLRQGFQAKPEPRRMGGNRELFGQHRDGHMIPLEVGLSPIRSDSETWVQAVVIDITERRVAEQRLREQAEQLMLANRYKSEFLANMSHELRTPLNSILILSDQLRQNAAGNLTDKQSRHADIIHRAGSDLLQLINDVLDLAKVEAGRMQLRLEPLNVQDMLVELDASLRPMAELKGLQLVSRVDPGVPRVIHSDRVRLHQILRNLLSNALKFTEQGEVELSVSVDAQDLGPGREMLRFSVRDTGIGIDPEQHERVFQAFQQIDGSTSRRFGGTGLGLAITRQLVLALDGQISLRSRLGEGACFTVCLPVAVGALEPEVELTEPLRSGEGPPVLIVEDDAGFAAVIAEAAQGHGFSTVLCSNGRQAVALLQEERYAAIILDILLPDLSGWQIYRRLRGLPNHRGTPVHIISCVPQPPDWNDSDTRYLVKPIGRTELEQVFGGLGEPDAQGHRILLVEDVEVERDHYREHLQQLGFEVVAVGTAEQAIVAYEAATFAAIVVDLNLPDLDGFELLDRLDARRSLRNVRVVVNTGLDVGQQHLQRLRRYSATLVPKSATDPAALGEAVQGFLDSLHTQPSTHGHSALEGARVLLVDDDVRNIYALTAVLDEAGLRVTPARDGMEAIACFQREPFDLILMDMAMPNMDGYTATRTLKEEHACHIPVIALTAHAMKGDREKCITAGADDYLAKPVNRQELLDMLERWLEAAGGRHDAALA